MALLSDDRPKIGQVIDIVKGKRITILCSETIIEKDILEAIHPKIDSCFVECSPMWNMNNETIKQANSGDCIQIPWTKRHSATIFFI